MKKWVVKELNKDPRKHGAKTHWSHKQKYNAVVQFLIYGTASAAAVASGIPYVTLKKWKVTPWWKQMEDEIRTARGITTQNRLSKLADKALDQLQDRVDHGELVWDNKKQLARRVAVNARNLNQIAKDAIDRDILLEKFRQQQPKQKETDDIRVRLDSIMDEFRRFAKTGPKREIKGEIIDVEDSVGKSEAEAPLLEGPDQTKD